MEASERLRRTEALILQLLEVEWEGAGPWTVVEREFDSQELAAQILGLATLSLVGVIRTEPELAARLKDDLWTTSLARLEVDINDERENDDDR